MTPRQAKQWPSSFDRGDKHQHQGTNNNKDRVVTGDPDQADQILLLGSLPIMAMA
jgi:hypothetical protein